MRLHVTRELARLSARVLTLAAAVRLLPRVGAAVDSEVAAVLEHLPAVFARVVPPTIVLRAGDVRPSEEGSLGPRRSGEMMMQRRGKGTLRGAMELTNQTVLYVRVCRKAVA